MGSAVVYNKLAKFGLRNAAETYKEEVRLRHRAAGDDRATAREAAEAAMWELFRPLVEAREEEIAQRRAEKAAAKAAEEIPAEPPAQLQGLPANTDSLLDPDYAEPDAGRQLRDGLLWVAFEWMRVVRDTDSGPVADIAAASKPPPNAFALLTLSTYALSDLDKRRELITRALAFADKRPDSGAPAGEEERGEQAGGFLHEIGGTDSAV